MKKELIIPLILTGLVFFLGLGAKAQETLTPDLFQKEEASASGTDENLQKVVSIPFTDIQGHWAEKDIEAVYRMGILTGISPNRFGPGEAITGNDLIFSLEKLFEQKVGKENNRTGKLRGLLEVPAEPVARMKAAFVIEEAFKVNELSVITTQIYPIFDDTKNISRKESSALSFVFNTGIMKGRTQKIFAPNDPVTRAELAVILNRTFRVLEIAEKVGK
ncbi:MAG TPA: hypothetical protein DEA47_04455 [Peptococcaceae bacterium]|nr:MAG: putative signaling protein [Clostridia bacterium 41_269]HBT20599.1 hypothetical protein [Peptococcaceae bacterium]